MLVFYERNNLPFTRHHKKHPVSTAKNNTILCWLFYKRAQVILDTFLGGPGDGAGRSLALLRYTTLQLYNKLYLLRFCTVYSE